MLKREIIYEDFNGNEVTEVFYFNLSKPELVEMEVFAEGGMSAFLQRIIEERDNRELLTQFKEVILKAYGEKSDDGKKFVKSDELRKQFEQTAAYQALFMELMTVEDAASTFVNGILPRDIVEATDQDKPSGPPPVPATN